MEKTYSKTAKGPSGVIGITKTKEAVLKWNILKHMKTKYTYFLYDVCNMSDDDEYSIHHEFSSSETALDELQVQQIFSSISKYGNPFDLGSSSIKNLVTCSEVDSKLSAIYLKLNRVGGTAYNDFRTPRLLEKSAKLFVTIPKIHLTKNSSKKLMLPKKQSSS